MRRILVDTNAYAAFKRGQPEAVDILREAEFVGISAVVLGELLSGFASGRREAQNRHELKLFLDSPRVRLLPVDENTAEFYARTYLHLRRKGTPIPSNDLWLAATALQHGAAIFTYDRHFQVVDGVIAGNQPSDFLP